MGVFIFAFWFFLLVWSWLIDNLVFYKYKILCLISCFCSCSTRGSIQPPPLPILCLSSLKVKYVFFSSMLSISVSHLSDLHVLGPNILALWCLTVLVGSFVGQDLLTLLFNSFPAAMFGNYFWKCFWLNPVIMHSIRSLVTSKGWDLGACMMLGISFYLFVTGRLCNIPWRRSELNLKLARGL
jgi:hypothetical protein